MASLAKATNIFWQECPVGRKDRQKLLNQKGCVVWITGLSGSGKSTLACTLGRELHDKGKLSYILDGDNLRHGLNKDLGFKAEHRAENIRRVGEVAKLFADSGLICIASLISPYRRDRDTCRSLLPDESFIEVYMNMSLELCESRDPKGLYKLARAGKIKGFTGIDDPYEPPLNCEAPVVCIGSCSICCINWTQRLCISKAPVICYRSISYCNIYCIDWHWIQRFSIFRGLCCVLQPYYSIYCIDGRWIPRLSISQASL